MAQQGAEQAIAGADGAYGTIPPALLARAGLQVDDRLVAIGGEPVAKRPLAEWRQRLRELPAGTKITIEYARERGGQTTTLTLLDRIPGNAEPSREP